MWTTLTSVLIFLGLTTGQPILITSAAQYEAQPTLDLLEKEGVVCRYYELGVSINAATGIAATKEAFAGSHVIYLTSGGSFVNETGKLPYLTTSGDVYFSPTSSRLTVDGDPSLVLGNCLPTMFPPFSSGSSIIDLPLRDIVVSPTISHTTDIDISGLPEKPMLLENMEMYYLSAAFSEAKNLSVVVAVTNEVGPNAFTQYKKYKDEAANMTAKYVLNLLKKRPSEGGVHVLVPTLTTAGIVVLIVTSVATYRHYKAKALRNQMRTVVYDLETTIQDGDHSSP